MTVMIEYCLVQVWAEDTNSSRYSSQHKQIQLKKAACTTQDCWHNSRLCAVHYTYRNVQGVLIAGWSDRVSYSDCAAGCKIRVSDPGRSAWFFSSLKCPDRLWDKGCRDSSLGVKWPGHGVDHSSSRLRLRMSGAVPLLPHYAFMAWIRQISLMQDSTAEGCNKPCL